MKRKNVFTIRRDEVFRHLRFFMKLLDNDAIRYANDAQYADYCIKEHHDRIIGIAMCMNWSDIFDDMEMDNIIDNTPSSYYSYKKYYEKFVELYKYFGGDYLESMR